MDFKNKRLISIIFRAVGFAVGVAGLAMMFSMSGGASMLNYFTIQTNIFVVVLFGVLLVKGIIEYVKQGKEGEAANVMPVVQGAVTFFITITGVIYWTLLSWMNFGMSGDAPMPWYFKLSNVIVHGIIPLFAIVDFVLFLPRNRLKNLDALAWLTYPIAYCGYIFIHAAAKGATFGGLDGSKSRFPYPFMDVDMLGWWFLLVFLGLAGGFYGLGRLYVFIDKKLSKAVAAPSEAAAPAEEAPAEEDKEAV